MTVSMIAAMTLNGKLGPASYSSSQDRSFLETMRDKTDASLLGAGTLRNGDPEMMGSDITHFQNRLRSIITRSGDIPIRGKRLFAKGPQPIIFTSRERCQALMQKTGLSADVVAIPERESGLSVAHALAFLVNKGAKSILIEGGGKLNHTCLSQGVIDELWVTIVPLISVDDTLPALFEGSRIPLTRLDPISVKKGEFGELFIQYKVHKQTL